MMLGMVASQGLLWNPADKDPNVVVSNGGRTFTAEALGSVRNTTSRSTGRWYYEVVVDVFVPISGLISFGIGTSAANLEALPGAADAFAWGYRGNGVVDNAGSGVASYASFVAGDIISVAFDLTSATKKLWFAKNGTWQSGNPGALTGGITISTGAYFAMAGGSGAEPNDPQATARPSLVFPMPSGFQAL